MQRVKELELSQCGLFKRGSERKLAEVLFISPKVLRQLRNDSCYRLKNHRDRSGKTRELQVPMGTLRLVHDRIHKLLSSLRTPEYLFSGRKGRSTLGNADMHISGKYGLKMDIRKFFPNCTKKAVFIFFFHTLKMPRDVADLLAEVCTYRDFIPTGSPLSMSLAFWTYKKTFDRIHEEALRRGDTFTLFVDDMNFSSKEPISQSFEMQVRGYIKRAGHRINPKKTERSRVSSTRVVTGVGLTSEKLKVVPYKRIARLLEVVNSVDSVDRLSLKEIQSAIGMVQSGQEIKSNFFKSTGQRLRQVKERRKVS